MPSRFRRQANTLLEQFNIRGDELTWNSDGVIFIDQVSIPNSDIFILFPYLFKTKHPKDLQGFDDFIDKITQLGLSHLIVKKSTSILSAKSSTHLTKMNKNESKNWWYLD